MPRSTSHLCRIWACIHHAPFPHHLPPSRRLQFASLTLSHLGSLVHDGPWFRRYHHHIPHPNRSLSSSSESFTARLGSPPFIPPPHCAITRRLFFRSIILSLPALADDANLSGSAVVHHPCSSPLLKRRDLSNKPPSSPACVVNHFAPNTASCIFTAPLAKHLHTLPIWPTHLQISSTAAPAHYLDRAQQPPRISSLPTFSSISPSLP